MVTNKRKIMGIFCTLLGGLAWGFSACFGEYLFENVEISTIFLITIRLLVAGMIFVVIDLVSKGKKSFLIFKNKKDTLQMIIFGLVGMLMCQYTFYQTIKFANAGTAAVMQSLGTVCVLIAVSVMARKMPSGKKILAIIIALVGVFLLNTKGDFAQLSFSAPVLFNGLLSAVGVAAYSMLSARLIRKYGVYCVAGFGMLFGGLAILPFSKIWAENVAFSIPLIVGMSGVIILGTAVAFGFFLKGVSIIGPLMGSLLGTMEPVSAVIISAVILKSAFSIAEIVAFVLILGSVFWLCLLERENDESVK